MCGIKWNIKLAFNSVDIILKALEFNGKLILNEPPLPPRVEIHYFRIVARLRIRENYPISSQKLKSGVDLQLTLPERMLGLHELMRGVSRLETREFIPPEGDNDKGKER